MKRQERGFTLLELLVVVVIIGILAALAVPRLIGAVERARQAEARHWLGVIRESEIRYRLENPNYTTLIGSVANGSGNLLDVDSPHGDGTNSTVRYFDYVVAIPGTGCPGGAPGNDFTLTATRTALRGRPDPPPGVPPAYTVILTENGEFCGTAP